MSPRQHWEPSLDVPYVAHAFSEMEDKGNTGELASLHALSRAFSALGNENAAVKRILLRVGSHPVGMLGTGTEGVVFRLSDGRALKITNGLAEVAAAAVVRKHPHPNLIAFYDSFLMVGKHRSTIGVIVRDMADIPLIAAVLAKRDPDGEFYYELDDETRYNISELAEACFYCQRASAAGPFPGERSSKYRRYMKDRMARWINCFKNSRREGSYLLDTRYASELLAAMEHLFKIGVYTIDAHPGNVGLKDGRIVIFDIGYSSVPGEYKVMDVAAVVENPPALDVIEV